MKRYINTEKSKVNIYKKISLFLLLFVSLSFINSYSITITDLTPKLNFTSTTINQTIIINTSIKSNCFINISNNINNPISMISNNNLTHNYNFFFLNLTNITTNYYYNISCSGNIIDTQTLNPPVWSSMININPNLICYDEFGRTDIGPFCNGDERIQYNSNTNSQNAICKNIYGNNYNMISFTFADEYRNKVGLYGGGFYLYNGNGFQVGNVFTSFICEKNINETNNYNSFLTRLSYIYIPPKISTTTQLPQVGKDVGGFLGNLAPSVVDFMLNFVIITLIISMVVVPLIFIRKFNK